MSKERSHDGEAYENLGSMARGTLGGDPLPTDPVGSGRRGRPASLPILPIEFWDARPTHKHIRQAAHSRLASADLVFHAVLAKLAAMRSHQLTFNSGRPGSLNYFVAAVGASGIGKSSGAAVVDDQLLIPPPYLSRPPEAGEPEPFHDGLPLGSGEGIAESFMGVRDVQVDEKPDGTPVTKKARCLVRHNVFITVDEGEQFTRLGERTGATIGATIRSAWVGATIGQANGRDDTTRIIKAGEYALGMLVGFQPSTALPLLTDTATGTAQRFLWCSAADPTIPDEHVSHPGRIETGLIDRGISERWPLIGEMSFPPAIVADLRREHIAKVRGDVVIDESDSQGPLMRCKMAALLALLDGRAHVDDDDWNLAGMLWDTSRNLRDTLIAQGADQKARQAEVIAQARIDLEERKAAAVNGVDGKIERLAVTLAAHVINASGLTRGQARKVLAGRDRHLFDQAVERAHDRDLLRLADGGGLLPPLRAAG